MKLFEFEAKSLASNMGINTPRNGVASTPEEAREIHRKLGGTGTMIKAQVLVAGRAKAGGVKFANKPEEAFDRAKEMLGGMIKGERVAKVLVEQKLQIKKELYVSIAVDRLNKCQTVLASKHGGIDIEEVAKKTPGEIVRKHVDPVYGMRGFEAREIALNLGYEGKQLNTLADLLSNLFRLSVIYDAELAETNPLVETEDGRFVAADLRVIVDDNSLFRHPEFQEKTKESGGELTPLEARAREANLAFVELDGDVGIIGNGAGLVMATLDLVKYYGGNPANFCDVGGGAAADKVATALGIIQSSGKVRTVFVNILAGITRSDEVAKGIVEVKKVVGLKKPLVVRMVGTNEEEGRKILQTIGITPYTRMEDAAQIAAKGGI